MWGFTEDSPGKIISGGPMMGIAQHSLDVPIIKGTGGILILTKRKQDQNKYNHVLNVVNVLKYVL